MAIQFKATAQVNPQDVNADKKFYARAVSAGDATLKQLSSRISSMSTVNSGDILAVLDLLTQVMREEIAAGRVIRLGEFGSFSVTLRSDGVEKPEDLTSAAIKDARLQFRPGSDLKNQLKTLQYQKVKTDPATPAVEPVK